MSANCDPDDNNLIDFGVFRSALERHIDRDGRRDADEHRLIQLFDEPYQSHKGRHVARKAFDALMRNGLTRKTRDRARNAGLTVVIGEGGYPANVIPFPCQDEPQEAA